jgi:assimilatory nitrate reductase electron transfer subunit
MAGTRFVDEVRLRDPGGQRVQLTVIGAEPHTAYNRVLLSSVLAGSLGLDAVRLHDSKWAERNRVDLRLGRPVGEVCVEAQQVRLAGGERLDYDVLVLATGAIPWFPPVSGLCTGDGSLADGAVAFRSLEDCRWILARAQRGEPVVVLGGGVLGLEAAGALAGRGNPVTVVHPMGHLMERVLDPSAGQVLAEQLESLGVRVLLNAEATAYRPGRLELATGGPLDAGLLVVATGVRPDTRLARTAGLGVRAGILVDDQLRTSDERIHAIGDCVEHPLATSGLVDPAFDQAGVLADLVTGTDPGARYRGTRTVVRLKARGIELTALGESRLDPNTRDAEVICLRDPSRGRYAKVVLRDNRVTGALMLGFPDAAATITGLHDSGAPAPSDRLALLLGRALPAEPTVLDPAELPANTLVCRCNSVTKAHLQRAFRERLDLPERAGVAGLVASTNATTGCGGCRNLVGEIAHWLAATDGSGVRGIQQHRERNGSLLR